jgi:purine-binding chemotaxis protein CheW
MVHSPELLVFTLDSQRYALPLAAVERIVRAAEITPLPNAPAVVLGALDVEGTILPVLSLRRRFQLSDREVTVTDQFLIARTDRRTVVLVIDEAQGMLRIADDRITHAAGVVPGLAHLQGVAALEDGLVLIHDLEGFLSLDEAAALDAAMIEKEEAPHGR